MTEPSLNPNVTRSRVVLEIASAMLGAEDTSLLQAKVTLTPQGGQGRPLVLSSPSQYGSLQAVLSREADLAIVNPTGALSVAVRGGSQWGTPQPLRAIAVIPSADQYVFAVRPETGLERFEQIAERRAPLKVSLRGQPDHCLHPILDDIVAAAGFSLDDLRRWGGDPRLEGRLPYPDSDKFKALVAGTRDAIFDEAADSWVGEALDAGMRILPLAEATVKTLEAMGYRRNYIRKSAYPKLPADVLTIDFSGWPIFVHADADDALVEHFCAGLLARKDNIPWEGAGPLPVERLCRDALDTPQDVPLHPAADRFWRACGFLD
jgi:hypothetical protein